MKSKHVRMYMEMASVAAKQSYANRLKVGALFVKDNRILSVGYNGTPPGTDNSCEDESFVTKKEVIHAEMNAIYKMVRDGQSSKGSELFVTHAPCFECSKALMTIGVSKVWYKEEYRDKSGIDMLKENGIGVEKYVE